MQMQATYPNCNLDRCPSLSPKSPSPVKQRPRKKRQKKEKRSQIHMPRLTHQRRRPNEGKKIGSQEKGGMLLVTNLGYVMGSVIGLSHAKFYQGNKWKAVGEAWRSVWLHPNAMPSRRGVEFALALAGLVSNTRCTGITWPRCSKACIARVRSKLLKLPQKSRSVNYATSSPPLSDIP